MHLDLPEPEPAALAHSTILADQIRQSIEGAGGWISFAEYMQLALYKPGFGYYSAGAAKFGEPGDFVTAPEISRLFSECLAGQLAEALDSVQGSQVLELGAGQGSMAVGILLELERLGALPKAYLILETSADLRARQRHTIETQAAHLADRVRWLNSAPAAPINGAIVANEVADALPVNRFIVDETKADRICELGVAWIDDHLASSTRPASGALLKSLVPVLDLAEFQPTQGYTSEVSLQLPGWIASIADWLGSGIAVLIDYGYARSEYYRSDRRDGTLRCFYQHRAHDDPFLWPGLQDISAWVDFTLLAESADAAGLSVAGYTTQAQFLLASGIGDRFEASEYQTSAQRAIAAQGMQRLMLPGEMGETVKVMTLTSGSAAPAGLLGRDMRSAL